MTDIDRALTPIKQSQRMLAEAKTMPELKDLRDYATAAREWAKARKMGVGAENEAAEVIIRAERKIGEQLVAMQEAGELAKPGQYQFGEGNRAHKSGPPALHEVLDVPRGSAVVRQAHDWKSLAQLDDETFESMLDLHHIEGLRIAKVNFYNALKKAQAPRSERAAPPTPEDGDFAMFRAGAFALLGWYVDDNGAGSPTRNGLLTLPDDELALFRTLVQYLANAYTEARNVRRGDA